MPVSDSGGSDGARQLSADGHELRFAVNYSGRLPSHLAADPTRCARARLRALSMSPRPASNAIDFDDVMLTRGYSDGRAYTQSKLAQVIVHDGPRRNAQGHGRDGNACPIHATYMDTPMVRQAGHSPLAADLDEERRNRHPPALRYRPRSRACRRAILQRPASGACRWTGL